MDTDILANDFKRQWQDVREDVLAAVERVGASGWYVLGEEVRLFEEELARHWDVKYAVGVASGLDAIEIALRVLGCGPGDRVLTTPLSAFATTLAILKIGAVPVFVDTDDRGLIDLERCRDVLRRRPEIRYFVPVHLYGHVVDLRRFERVRMVEDCAQSIGTSSGRIGPIAATSFYPTKNLGAMGDGGAILTNDPELAEQARVLRSYGETAKYRHERIGYNSRLDELQAAILRSACLPKLDRWLARRREIAREYLQGIEPYESAWHLFPMQVKPERRAEFIGHLKTRGIVAGIHYPVVIPDQPAMKSVQFEMADDCSEARRICASEVSLPIHPYLTDDEVSRVIDAVSSWYRVFPKGSQCLNEKG